MIAVTPLLVRIPEPALSDSGTRIPPRTADLHCTVTHEARSALPLALDARSHVLTFHRGGTIGADPAALSFQRTASLLPGNTAAKRVEGLSETGVNTARGLHHDLFQDGLRAMSLRGRIGLACAADQAAHPAGEIATWRILCHDGLVTVIAEDSRFRPLPAAPASLGRGDMRRAALAAGLSLHAPVLPVAWVTEGEVTRHAALAAGARVRTWFAWSFRGELAIETPLLVSE